MSLQDESALSLIYKCIHHDYSIGQTLGQIIYRNET